MLILECSQGCYGKTDVGSGRKDGRGRMVALLYSFATSLGRGTYKERNEIKTKRNEINENETKRNETKSTK